MKITTKITIEIGDTKLELTLEEARSLYNALARNLSTEEPSPWIPAPSTGRWPLTPIVPLDPGPWPTDRITYGPYLSPSNQFGL